MTPDPTSLDRLHDIVAPSPVPWWPPAPGWYFVLGILAVAGIALTIRGIHRWQSNRYRREALAEWQRLQPLLVADDTRAEALASLAELLKRTALSVFPRRQVASLTGDAWLAFLDRTGSTSAFRTPAGAILGSAAYDSRRAAATSKDQIAEAAGLARQWLAHHRVEEQE